ncbi:hypothetical protein [Deinococcus cellulosilyticus]|uniref:Uncharacterized protein n=1 Tax=Deinococcus cellulosilyticus (strain DSM 18568 / NBRC 106333 / KACC 11606 / 5516J-15) TaxID=1223518 RepID=A0A511N1U4_DEIC1|nr:hypothetical protein [Deinococcus cellulosilyticus]GEM46832.1 hypothetical protein DC3_24670 [Deinococcus cellulosilyticus NBRC 106333 = KACC 11606]
MTESNGPFLLTIYLTACEAESAFRTLVQHARSSGFPVELPLVPVKLPEHHQNLHASPVEHVLSLHGNLKSITGFVEVHRDLIMGNGFVDISPVLRPLALS